MIRIFSKIFLCLWISLLGIFLYLVFNATRAYPCNQEADAIIVLTGSDGRIQEGLKLWNEKKAPKLFISGVFKETHLLKKDNLIIGFNAKNTDGNIMEIKDWIEKHDLKNIILISHDYHIPRIKMLLKQYNIKSKICFHIISSNWSLKTFSIFFIEYHKFLRSFVLGLF